MRSKTWATLTILVVIAGCITIVFVQTDGLGDIKELIDFTRKDLTSWEIEYRRDEPEGMRRREAERAEKALEEDRRKGLLVLVNKFHDVGDIYEPEDLEEVKYFASDRAAYGRRMRKEAAEAFNQLSEAAREKGHEIVVTTAFRSYEFQSTLYNNYVASHGQEEADTFSARPGYSEHQTGLAADVSSPSVKYRLTRDYENYPEGAWLRDNCRRFGFIIRFPQGKERITGYIYEPWHIRYVGKTAANEMFEAGLTLEEYLEEKGFAEEEAGRLGSRAAN